MPVVLRNNGRDQITFELAVLEDGEPKRDANGRILHRQILLGSVDDHGLVGAPQPEVEVSDADWGALKEMPAVAGLIADQKVSAYRPGAAV